MVGQGADQAAGNILPAVNARPRLRDRLEALVRVDDRRWDLRLKDGSLIQLPAGAKLTPAAQKENDAFKKAQAEKKAYKDDIGACWPAGLPMIMTRVWSIAMVQLPTVVYMVSGFMNSLRIVNMDGRPHTDPDLLVRTANGDSIGRWEGDALVIDTVGFKGDHHWIASGIPASDQLHIVERVKLVGPDGAKMQIEYTMTDPKNWEGEWKMTKQWNRVDSRDMEIAEVECLPDLNSHIPSTQSKENVR